MKYIKLLMIVIFILPNSGFSKDQPYPPYKTELRKMREILIKTQLCTERHFLSWGTLEEVMWKYYEGLDQLTFMWKEDVHYEEVLVGWEYYRRGYREEIRGFISSVSSDDVKEELIKHTLFVRHFNTNKISQNHYPKP